jgi:hypothetical protein
MPNSVLSSTSKVYFETAMSTIGKYCSLEHEAERKGAETAGKGKRRFDQPDQPRYGSLESVCDDWE